MRKLKPMPESHPAFVTSTTLGKEHTMNTRHLLALAAVGITFGMLGCEDKSTPSSNQTTAPGYRQSTSDVPGPIPNTPAPNADNTAKNHPDKATSDKTPMDQSNTQSDIDISAAIRQAIMKADNMSTNAQNCKVITNAGTVTLRGPVNSQAEKDAIGALARQTAGVVRVDNLLEVKTNP